MSEGINKRDFLKKSFWGAIFGIAAPKVIDYDIKPPLIGYNKPEILKTNPIKPIALSGCYIITGTYQPCRLSGSYLCSG